jgi:hypothetical protein
VAGALATSARRTASLLLVAALTGASVPTLAIAQGTPINPASNPLSPGVPQLGGATPTTTSTATPTVSTTATSSDSGLSGSGVIAIAVGALIVLGGISLFIWRDARKRAPVRRAAAALADDGRSRTGSKARPKQRKLSPAERKRRKRGKAR